MVGNSNPLTTKAGIALLYGIGIVAAGAVWFFPQLLPVLEGRAPVNLMVGITLCAGVWGAVSIYRPGFAFFISAAAMIAYLRFAENTELGISLFVLLSGSLHAILRGLWFMADERHVTGET